MPTIEELVSQLGDLKVTDLVALTKRLEEDWGVSASQLMQQVTPVDNGDLTPFELPQEAQTEFAVWLTSYGPTKINVIKAVREIRTLDLKSAKELVESAPVAIMEDVTREDAERFAQKLRQESAVVEIR